MNTRYISFCGTFLVPDNESELNKQFLGNVYLDDEGFEEIDDHTISGVHHEMIDSEDSLRVYLAILQDKMLGHLIADCPAAGWTESTFVLLDEHNIPKRPETNINPNPIRQLGTK